MLLEEYKRDYKKSANNIEGWEKINKNVLCNLYIQNEDNREIAGYYFSAIVYKYWYLIDKFYKLSPKVVTPEDVYEWLIDSIIYALDHRMWLNPESTIYQDKNGPDKVINRCMACRRFTFYQAINRKKRKGGFGTASIDEMMESFKDNTNVIEDIASDDVDTDSDIMLRDFIRSRFLKGDSLGAFTSDIIAYSGDVFSSQVVKGKNKYKMSLKKLVRFFQEHLDETYVNSFAQRYELPIDVVKDEWNKWSGGSTEILADQLIPNLYLLSQTPYLSEGREEYKTDFNNDILINRKNKKEGTEQVDLWSSTSTEVY